MNYIFSKRKKYNRKKNTVKKNKISTSKKITDKIILKNRVSQDTVNKIYPLLQKTVQTLDKNKIDYWATGGTLLGTIRSKGMIQWDDDIDIAINIKDVSRLDNLKSVFNDLGLRLYKASGKYFKVKYGHRRDDHLWIDIFIVDEDGFYLQGHKVHRRYLPGELYPLKRGKYGNISIRIPNKSREYLTRIFPDWKTIAHMYNHADKKKHKITMRLTPELKKPLLPKY
tara:strand:+ start:1492 stop:2169 length:678 start_codon:yes stop_codon:yes gene_type:complete